MCMPRLERRHSHQHLAPRPHRRRTYEEGPPPQAGSNLGVPPLHRGRFVASHSARNTIRQSPVLGLGSDLGSIDLCLDDRVGHCYFMLRHRALRADAIHAHQPLLLMLPCSHAQHHLIASRRLQPCVPILARVLSRHAASYPSSAMPSVDTTPCVKASIALPNRNQSCFPARACREPEIPRGAPPSWTTPPRSAITPALRATALRRRGDRPVLIDLATPAGRESLGVSRSPVRISASCALFTAASAPIWTSPSGARNVRPRASPIFLR